MWRFFRLEAKVLRPRADRGAMLATANEREICALPALSREECSLLDMHSVLNVLNVLRGELALIGLALAGDPDHLRDSLRVSDGLIRGLRDPEQSLAAAAELERHVAAIRAELEVRLDERARADSEIQESLRNLEAVFGILRVRAAELLARARTPMAWCDYAADRLRREFVAVLDAMARTSRGRFGVVYNPARQGPGDYYVDLRVDGQGPGILTMPPVFHDVMRDLLANARKYTAPGGQISAAYYADRNFLRLVVTDTGCGIPPDEIEAVFQFGRRASNVGQVRTMGGGFGLTKALLCTKRFDGRLWISSRLGGGTSVRVEVPVPAQIAAGAAA